MVTFGIPSERRLESLHIKADGTPEWAKHVPPGLFLVDSPCAPWNCEARVVGQIDGEPLLEAVDRDPASYPGLLWTPPAVVPLVKLPQPVLAANERAVPELTWHVDRVERGWRIETVQAAAPTRRVWQNSGAFLDAFTIEERGAIDLSENIYVAGLRATLYTHQGEVWSDDPRIQQGMALLVATGILTQLRASAIVTPPGLT